MPFEIVLSPQEPPRFFYFFPRGFSIRKIDWLVDSDLRIYRLNGQVEPSAYIFRHESSSFFPSVFMTGLINWRRCRRLIQRQKNKNKCVNSLDTGSVVPTVWNTYEKRELLQVPVNNRS